MSSYLYNKALKNVKFNNDKSARVSDSEISDLRRTSFNLELKSIEKSIELKKLQRIVLFDFLCKYERNMPELFFYNNVISLGEVLMKYKYWASARNECYERYLVAVVGVSLETLCSDIDASLSKCLTGDEDHVELTVCAIFGICRATLGDMESIDPMFESEHFRSKCQVLLKIYQKTLEMILPIEKYCWLIYNGTVHIYEICQKLISFQLAEMATEPLIWASCCLETSIPLLTMTNLRWRSIIYSAGCQALYNQGKDSEAEWLARRGLVKITELNTLYEMSSEPLTIENSLSITEATIRMGVMIFRRTAFEIRRRPKNSSKPKTKVNFKELLQGNWPRTGTEKLLAEMFESPSQQALAIIEAIKQPSKVLGEISLPAGENDWDILDVYSELFHAFTAIITGRSSVTIKAGKTFVQDLRAINNNFDEDQVSLAVKSSNEVSAKVVFDMICWAFTYSNWEFTDVIVEPFITILKESKAYKECASMVNTLQLLMLMKKVVHCSKLDKKSVKLMEQSNDDDKNKDNDVNENVRSTLGSVSSMSKDTKSSKSKRDPSTDEVEDKSNFKSSQDPVFQLATFLEVMISEKDFDVSLFYKEILIEAGRLLWSKCKSIFHSVQDGSFHNQVMQNIQFPGKWIYILSAVHHLFSLTNYAQLDALSYAEVSIRLALLLEEVSLGVAFHCEKDDYDGPTVEEFIATLKGDMYSKSTKCLMTAKDILKRSIEEMNKFRNGCSLNTGGQEKNTDEAVYKQNFLNDMFLELNSLFFRVSIRGMMASRCIRLEDKVNLSELKTMDIYKNCLAFCNKNFILKALFYANLTKLFNEILPREDILQLADMTRNMLEKAEDNLSVTKSYKNKSDNALKLPPPIIIQRGSDFITVKLDLINMPEDLKEKVGWVRLYGRAVDSPNAEVRLTDDKLSGTGLETSSLNSSFIVRDLEVNEQYIFAFSAFDKCGSMIGRGMGVSSKTILATDSLSIITSYSIVAQIFFEIRLKEEVIWYEGMLWDHFMEPLLQSTAIYKQSSREEHLIHHNYTVRTDKLNTTSTMMLRQLCLVEMSAIDCYVEIHSITTELPMNSVKVVKEQILRIQLCDKLLAMFAISKKLKNHLLTMELFGCIVSLMIPLMNHNQFYEPFAEILKLSILTLHSLPQTTWIKIPVPLKTNLHHMIASVGFFLLKYYYKYNSSIENLESIRNLTSILLQISSDAPFKISEQHEDTTPHSNVTSRIDHSASQKQVLSQKKTFGRKNKGEESSFTGLSRQQAAFDSYKYSKLSLGSGDHSLSGTDEPDILLTYIANLPSKAAYKEVVKFSRKTRYLEFVVEVVHKAMVEGNLDLSLSIYKDIREWIRKRNEMILGRTVIQPPSQMNVDLRRTDVTEGSSSKEQSSREAPLDDELDTVKRHQKSKKKTKYKRSNSSPDDTAVTVTLNMNEVQKQKQEEAELKAITVLTTFFPLLYKQSMRRRRFRQISENEISSRVKLNSSMSMSFLGIAQSKIDTLIQLFSAAYQLSELSKVEDVTKYMLNRTGKILSLDGLLITEQKSPMLKITKNQNDQTNDRPRTFRPDMKVQDKRIISEAPKLLTQFSENLNKVGLLLKKAIILSERGKKWLLLSRATSIAWNALNVIINIVIKVERFINNAKNDYPNIDWDPIKTLNIKEIFKMFLDPFYFGSEFLMDLIESSNSEKNANNFDKEFINNFILRTLHLLYETKRYEKFIHIALRFTNITRGVFVNITHPLLVESQEALLQMSRDLQKQDPFWTDEMSQEHVTKSLLDLQWNHIDSSNYGDFLKLRSSGKIGKVNLTQLKKNFIYKVPIINNEASNIKNMISIFTLKNESWPLFSVSVDVEVTLGEWRRLTDQKSVKRLWNDICNKKNLYFYQRRVPKHKSSNLISFNELVNSFKDYLEVFKGEGLKEYCGLLQRDLGDIYLHKKLSLSLSLWKESLNNFMDQKDALEYLEGLPIVESIRETQVLVEKYGVLKCITVAGVLSRIIRCTDFKADRRQRLCLQAAAFYKAVYGSSLAHSNNDLDYFDELLTLDAIDPTPLIYKVHLSSDQCRNDMSDIESQVWFILDELVQAGHYKIALPLMSLYEHITCVYFRDSLKSIKIRILKLEAALELRQFGYASKILFQILTGEKQPLLLDSQMSQGISKNISEVYDDNKPILEENNIKVIDRVMSKRLNGTIAQRIGLTLTNKISILQARFLLEMASIINGSVQTLDIKVDNITDPKTTSKKVTIKAEIVYGQAEDIESLLEEISSRMQWESWKEISLPQLKGVMLLVASGILQPIFEDVLTAIQKEHSTAWKVEQNQIENVILGLLLQAKICRVQSLNRSGARMAMFACKIFDKMKEFNVSTKTQTRDESTLNIRLHLQCNKEIVECLLREVGIGQILDLDKTSICDVPDLKALLLSCIAECENNSLYQKEAWFMAALAKYALNSGFEAEKYYSILKDAVDILGKEMMLSQESRSLVYECRYELMNYALALGNIERADHIEKDATNLKENILKDLDNKYPQSVFWNIQDPLLSLAVVVNQYDGLYEQLSRINLLLAVALLKYSKESDNITNTRLRSLKVLNYGLNILRSICDRKPWVEVEFLMTIGRLQRYLLMSKDVTSTSSISTLVEGLKLSLSSSGHLGIQRQFFLELSLTFMVCTEMCSKSFNGRGEVVSSADISFKAQLSMKLQSKESAMEVIKFRKLAWLSLKCANNVAECMKKISKYKSDSSRLLLNENSQKLPISICFDIYGRFLLGDKRVIFKNEIEKELSRMPEARIPKDSEQIEDQVERIKLSMPALNWSQLLAYQDMIVKTTNNQFLTVDKSARFNLPIITRRISACTTLFLKEFEMHKFLKSELDDYETKCVPFIPKDILQFSTLNTKEGLNDEGNEFVNSSLSVPLTSENNSEEESVNLVYSYFPQILENIKFIEKHALERMDINELELSLQTFKAPFEDLSHSHEKVLLLYSCTKKLLKNVTKVDNFVTGWRVILASELIEVYESFHETAHLLEILSSNSEMSTLLKTVDTSKKLQSSTSNKTQRSAGLQPSSNSASEMSDVELRVRRALDIIQSWSSEDSTMFAPPKDSLVKGSLNTWIIGEESLNLTFIPFDLNRDNVRALSLLFNPVLPKNIINNPQIIKFLLECLKIDFL